MFRYKYLESQLRDKPPQIRLIMDTLKWINIQLINNQNDITKYHVVIRSSHISYDLIMVEIQFNNSKDEYEKFIILLDFWVLYP